MTQKSYNLILVINFLIFIFLQNNYLLSNDNSVDENADKQSIEFIKKNITVGKKYNINEATKYFNTLMIGFFSYAPIAAYEFNKNNEFKIWYFLSREDANMNKNEKIQKGKWLIRDNKLIMKPYGSNMEYTYEIKYFQLRYNEDYVVKYTFDIEFTTPLYIGGAQLRKEFN